jgi:hypothetical protein
VGSPEYFFYIDTLNFDQGTSFSPAATANSGGYGLDRVSFGNSGESGYLTPNTAIAINTSLPTSPDTFLTFGDTITLKMNGGFVTSTDFNIDIPNGFKSGDSLWVRKAAGGTLKAVKLSIDFTDTHYNVTFLDARYVIGEGTNWDSNDIAAYDLDGTLGQNGLTQTLLATSSSSAGYGIENFSIGNQTIAGFLPANNTVNMPLPNLDVIATINHGAGGTSTDNTTNEVNVTLLSAPAISQSNPTDNLNYATLSGAQSINSNIVAATPDNTALSSAKVQITNGFNASNDLLTFSADHGITGNYNSSTGVLSLTGNASAAQYSQVLASVQYTNNSPTPNMADKTLEWSVNDGTHQSNTFTSTIQMATPLILDLDGDGIETLALNEGVYFDITGDGIKEHTAWVAKDDALLVRDINQDGQINDASELFGSATQLQSGQQAEDGFAALSDLDSNFDGVIDQYDKAYGELNIWQDRNSDGQVQAGELSSLSAANIASLQLNAQQSSHMDNGNLVGLSSSWQDNLGNDHELADVWFQYQKNTNQSSHFADFKNDEQLFSQAAAQSQQTNLDDLQVLTGPPSALETSENHDNHIMS